MQLYKDTLELIGDKLGPADANRDNEWVERMQVSIFVRTKLDSDGIAVRIYYDLQYAWSEC